MDPAAPCCSKSVGSQQQQEEEIARDEGPPIGAQQRGAPTATATDADADANANAEGVLVLVDGEWVFVPPDTDTSTGARGFAERPSSPEALRRHLAASRIQAAVRGLRTRRALSLEQARIELRAAVALVRTIGRRGEAQLQIKSLQLAECLLEAGGENIGPAEVLFRQVFESCALAYGGAHPITERAARGLARIYRARGEEEQARMARRRGSLPFMRSLDTFVAVSAVPAKVL